jgi:alpha-ribazole phosphatase
MTRLYLIRHARPDIGDGICYGSTDLPVAQQEHQRLLAALVSNLPKHVPVFSSPLRRCRELATPLANALESGEVIYDPRLAEMHFGAWEMRPWSEIPRDEVDAWAKDLHRYRPGGGESVLEMAQRVHAFYSELRLRPCAGAVVVCHAGTIRLLSACMRQGSLSEMALDAAQIGHKIAYGEMLVLDC